MAKTNYLEIAFLNAVLRNTAYTSPATVYVGLFTTTPDDSGGGVEVTGGSYARQVVTFGVPSGSGSTSNVIDVTFPRASAIWGAVVAFAVCDALSGGNILYYGLLTTPRTVLIGDEIKFATGQLVVSED